MNTFKVMVVGPECSGSKWMARLLRAHPAITKVRHASYPENKGRRRQNPSIQTEKPDAIVVCCRDATITRLSQRRQGMNKLTPPGSVFEARVEIQSQLDSFTGAVAVVGYESLVQWPELVLRQVFWLLGIDPRLYNFLEVVPIDGNRKYVS